MDLTIGVDGLVEFERSVSGLQADFTGLSGEVTLSAATLVIEKAQPNVPKVSGKASKSLRAFQQGDDALAEGGSGTDYYAWLEFGGPSGRKHANVRKAEPEGRYLVPGYRMVANDIEQMMVDTVVKYVKDNGLDVD